MQDLENDIDDLFKRAGEHYSPQQGNGDWESIAQRIADTTNEPKAGNSKQNKKNRKIIVIFLFLFVMAGSFYKLQNGKHFTSLSEDEKRVFNGAGSTPNEAGGTRNEAGSTPNKADSNREDDNNGKGDTAQFSIAKKLKANFKQVANRNTLLETPEVVANATAYLANKMKHTNAIAIIDNTNNKSTLGTSENFVLTKNDSVPNVAAQTRIPNASDSNNQLQNRNSNPPDSNVAKKQTPRIPQNKKHFYLGLIVAADFSKVKTSAFNDPGFDAGFLLGFSANKKLSVETGLIWNKKKYRSEGKNFSMEKLQSSMPSGMVIKNLESNSSLIEVPVTIKYDLVKKKSSNVFIAAGASAYIMTREKNDYNTSLNSVNEQMVGIYTKMNYSVPAVANISIGYEHQVFGNAFFRVEPFLKIPLQGMGVGSLPVTSAGVQVGITHRLK